MSATRNTATTGTQLLHHRRRRPQVEMRRHDELHVVCPQRTGCREARHDLEARITPDDAFARMRHQPDWHGRMVPNACPHTRQIDDRLDAECLKLARWANAGAHKNRGRSDRAGAEDNAFRLLRASVGEPHACHPGAIERETIDHAVCANGQTPVAACRIQVREQGRNPRVTGSVHRPWSDPRTLRVIVIFDDRKTSGRAAFVKRPLNWNPLGLVVARDRDRAVPTVMWPESTRVPLQPLEIGCNGVKAPLRVAKRGPRVEISRTSPQRCRSIDCGRAADHLAALIGHDAAFDRNRFVAPIVRWPRDVFRVEQVGRRRPLAFIIRTRLQQDGSARLENLAWIDCCSRIDLLGPKAPEKPTPRLHARPSKQKPGAKPGYLLDLLVAGTGFEPVTFGL